MVSLARRASGAAAGRRCRGIAPGPADAADDSVVDADFEEVDGDKRA